MKLPKNIWTKMIPVIFLVLATAFLSLAVYSRMVETEMEISWERLEIATNSTAGKISIRIRDNINFLEAVADSYILTHEVDNVTEVGNYLRSVMNMTIFERIDVLQPDNTLITQDGEVVERGGKLSYLELAARGTHVSGRVTSSFTGREVICCVTPIEEEGVVTGLLIGTLDCISLGELFEVFTYGGDAQIFLIDRNNGDYLIDNWHDEFSNIHMIGTRESVDGSGEIDMAPAILNGESKRFAFYSEKNGEKSYQYCTPVDGFYWELCVVVQEEVVFKHVQALQGVLKNVGIVETLLVLVYFAWNVWLTIQATRNEEKAKHLEFETAKNEARASFISNMSHDIRTPLNGIVGMLQIIKNHRDDEEKVNECLEKISVSTQYLSTLAGDMLDINEIESNKLILQKELFDIRKVADEVSSMLEQRASSVGVEYQMDYSELAYPFVTGSEVHLKRILANLIGNAIKYSKDAGRNVWVTIKDEEMYIDKKRRMYKFIVKDNGIGMTEEFQKNMYNAFEQENVGARSDYQGYGLGLTIVNYLVKKMDGNIELESTKGVGSTFTVSISFVVNDETDASNPEENTNVDLTGMRILIVEDNDINREIAEVLLTDAGASVDYATNGKMATEMFAKSDPETYDIILMDIMMPIMDGCEATKLIRAMDRPDARSVVIIAMTASAFAEEIKRCEEVGMNAHIPKPLNVSRLMTEMEKYYRRPDDMRRKNNGTV